MKNHKNLKDIMTDQMLVRDIKTVVVMILALLIGIVTNGVFDGFSVRTIFAITVALSTIGLMASVFMVTNEFTQRGEIEEEENNLKIQEAKKNIYEKGKGLLGIKRFARKIIKRFNKYEITTLREDAFESTVVKYGNKRDKAETKIDNLKLVGVWKFNIIKRLFLYWRVKRLNRKLNKYTKKLSKTNINRIHVAYEPLELDDLIIENPDRKASKLSMKQKFNKTPAKHIRGKMTKTNLVKVIFFVGFQGMIYVGVQSWTEFFIRIAVVLSTLLSTAFFSYVSTRKWSNDVYLPILNEKVSFIEWVHEEALKLMQQEESQEPDQTEEIIPHDPFLDYIKKEATN